METINVTLSGLDCILIMPTGGGKSLCYQLPAILTDGKKKLFYLFKKLESCLGITIVISPLISLVEDQVYALRNLNIDARSLNTSTSREEQTEIMRILDGKNNMDVTLKILYLTPGITLKKNKKKQNFEKECIYFKKKLLKVKLQCQNYKNSMKQRDLHD